MGGISYSPQSAVAAGAFIKGVDTADSVPDGVTNKAYTGTEQTKLSGIETAADVTDATNVAAAGAHMKTPGDCLTLTDTTTATTGILFKGANRFLHNFHHPTGGGALPDGLNTFIGQDAGNFTMGSTATTPWK